MKYDAFEKYYNEVAAMKKAAEKKEEVEVSGREVLDYIKAQEENSELAKGVAKYKITDFVIYLDGASKGNTISYSTLKHDITCGVIDELYIDDATGKIKYIVYNIEKDDETKEYIPSIPDLVFEEDILYSMPFRHFTELYRFNLNHDEQGGEI